MKPKAYIIDIDGTVALKGDRDPYDWDRVGEDKPNTPVLNLLKDIRRTWPYRFYIFVSGRLEVCRLQTTMWLDYHWGHPYRGPYMRPESNPYGPDHEVKSKIYEEQIEPQFDVVGVFDDRNTVVAMWRVKHQLQVYQVADGNF